MDRRGGDNRNSKASGAPPNSTSKAWLHAIQQATKCVTPNGGRSFEQQEEVMRQIGYLELLASILEQYADDWDEVPFENPPPFSGTQQQQQDYGYSQELTTLEPGYHDPPPAAVVSVPLWNSTNRFEMFHDSDDASSSDDDDEISQEDDDHPTGTDAALDPAAAVPMTCNLSMRRIMIRIVTAQSEVYACQALHAPPQWQQGAQLYSMSLFKIHHALSLADSECARWLEQGDIPVVLREDANVVEVAINYLTQQSDKFRQLAETKERRLMQKLEPQWKSRDDVKSKMGERWTSNPHPKRDYAAIRAADEEQLRQIRAALQSLDDLDTEGAVESSRQLKNQMTKKKKKSETRNNGLRPTNLSKRVPLSEYPDPTEFGWTFTGSNEKSAVEFFENGNGVKLDWYYTTATVKTCLDHPKQGKTQLFAARVMPNTYLEILLNPRAHTNERYHEKQERKPSRDLWTPS